MWNKAIARSGIALAAVVALAGAAAGQDIVKVGMIMPLSGNLAAAGKQVLAGARLYVAEHGTASG